MGCPRSASAQGGTQIGSHAYSHLRIHRAITVPLQIYICDILADDLTITCAAQHHSVKVGGVCMAQAHATAMHLSFRKDH